MKTAALLLILIAFGNAQKSNKGPQAHLERCPADICQCETVQDTMDDTVFYMMATCTKMPSRLDSSIRFLKVTGQFDDITKNMITALGTNLRKLDLSDCKIMRIEKGAFSGLLIHLNSLKLSNNKLTELDEDIFHCPNLKKLFLDGNDLRKIHHNTFEQLKKLEFLYLQHNILKDISFNLPPTLFELNLYDNGIQSFEVDLSKVQLQLLDLCDNELQQFPFKASTKSFNLKSLCLSGKVSHLPEQFAARFPGLLNLTLKGEIYTNDKLDVKTQNEIRQLTNITTLALEYFHIQSLQFINNKYSLTILTLKNITLDNKAEIQNVFRTIPYLNVLCINESPDLVKPVLGEGSVVSQLTRLQYLSIQNTKLLSIAKFNIPQSVVQLNIGYNPLRCDCKLSWIVAKHKTSRGKYLQDVAHTTCSTPEKFDDQELISTVNPEACHDHSDGMLEQDIKTPNSTTERQDMESSDHTVLYIILGSCLVVLLVIGITLAIVLSVMKKKRRLQIAPEGGDTPMEQQQQQEQIKQSSSHDMLLKK